MAGKRLYNWQYMMHTFITSVEKVTFTELATEAGCAYATILKHAKAENWHGKRIEYHRKINDKALEKSAETIADKVSVQKAKSIDICMKMLDLCAIRLEQLQPEDLNTNDVRRMVIEAMEQIRKETGQQTEDTGGNSIAALFQFINRTSE